MPASRKRKRKNGSVARRRLRPAAPELAPAEHRRPATDVQVVVEESRARVRLEIGIDRRMRRLEDDVTARVNQYRTAHGLTILRRDERLRESARGHSADMRRRRFFAHVSPQGSTPGDRMRLQGFSNPAAENIAFGQRRPDEVMQSWIDSPDHRRNLLLAEIVFIGVGVFMTDDDGHWWTQNFGY